MCFMYFCLFICVPLIIVQTIAEDFELIQVGNGETVSSDQHPAMLRSDSTSLEREPDLITNADVKFLQSFVQNMNTTLIGKNGPFVSTATTMTNGGTAVKNSLIMINDTSDKNEVILENEDKRAVTRNQVEHSNPGNHQGVDKTTSVHGDQNTSKLTTTNKSNKSRSFAANTFEGMSASDTKALFSLVKMWKSLTSSTTSSNDTAITPFRGQKALEYIMKRKRNQYNKNYPTKLLHHKKKLDKSINTSREAFGMVKNATTVHGKQNVNLSTSSHKVISLTSHDRTEALAQDVEKAIANTTQQLMKFIKLEKHLKQPNISNDNININENILINTVNTLRKADSAKEERKETGKSVKIEHHTATMVPTQLGTGYKETEERVHREGNKNGEMPILTAGNSASQHRQQRTQKVSGKQRQFDGNRANELREPTEFKQGQKLHQRNKTVGNVQRKQQKEHYRETKKSVNRKQQRNLPVKAEKQQLEGSKKYSSRFRKEKQALKHRQEQHQQQVRHVYDQKQVAQHGKVHKKKFQSKFRPGKDKEENEQNSVIKENTQKQNKEQQYGNQYQNQAKKWNRLEKDNNGGGKKHIEYQGGELEPGNGEASASHHVNSPAQLNRLQERKQDKIKLQTHLRESQEEGDQHEKNESTLQPNQSHSEDKNVPIPLGNVNHEQGNQKQVDDIVTQEAQSSVDHSVGENKEFKSSIEFRLERLKELTAALSKDPFDIWIYRQRTFDELGVTPMLMKSGISNLGSSKAMQKIFRKVVRGRPVRLLIVGGSISAGGGLWKDWGNVDGVYYKALVDWWRKTITPVSRSDLEVNNVAIGGTDSEYFSYCLSNFIKSAPDLVLWELSANDYNRFNERDFDPGRPLEQLTRLILQLPSHPALIYINFFRGDRKHFDLSEKCPDSEETEVEILSRYYDIPSLSWRKMVCSLITDYKRTFISQQLFSDDGFHPSLLGHAQVAMLLTMYVKGVFQSVLADEMENMKKFGDEEDDYGTLQEMSAFQLKIPVFKDPLYPQPRCWTLLTPDITTTYENTLNDVIVLKGNGFELKNVTAWDVRTDRIQCLLATKLDATLELSVNVPVLDDDKNLPLYDAQTRTLAIATHNHYGGVADVQLDELPSKSTIVTESGRTLKQSKVHIISEDVRPGVHNLRFHSLSKGFCLTSIMVL